MKEQNIQAMIMMSESEDGNIVFRNNTGQLQDKNGRPVKFGLCVGSSDVIGMMPVTITQEMVGKKVAVFLAEEVKTAKGRTTAKQDAFIAAVNNAGGCAGVVRSSEDAKTLRSKFLETLKK